MPSWKKVIVSGSDAHINHVTASGNISGSSTSTGSFGEVVVGGMSPSGTSMRWKLALANNAVKIHGVSLQWK